METHPPQFNTENSPFENDSSFQKQILFPSPAQGAAHLSFIAMCLWMGLRWQFQKLFSPALPDTAAELKRLTGVCRRYINLLEGLKIIRTDFVGFDDVESWRGSVIAPNHPSILDAILIMSRIPSLDCVINARLLKSPLTVGPARLCDFIRNDDPLAMIKTCQQRLAEGSNILIFPEGTRTPTPPLGAFHHAYALAAKKAGAPIRTIFIECDSEYFGRDFSFMRPAKCPMPIIFRLTAGKIFRFGSEKNPRLLSAEIEEYFRCHLASDTQGIRLSRR